MDPAPLPPAGETWFLSPEPEIGRAGADTSAPKVCMLTLSKDGGKSNFASRATDFFGPDMAMVTGLLSVHGGLTIPQSNAAGDQFTVHSRGATDAFASLVPPEGHTW